MTIRNTQDLREFLVDQMEMVATNELSIGQARAVSGLAQQIYNTLKLEMQAAEKKLRLNLESVEPIEWPMHGKKRLKGS